MTDSDLDLELHPASADWRRDPNATQMQGIFLKEEARHPSCYWHGHTMANDKPRHDHQAAATAATASSHYDLHFHQ